jgi:hypothetical protein
MREPEPDVLKLNNGLAQKVVDLNSPALPLSLRQPQAKGKSRRSQSQPASGILSTKTELHVAV